MRTQMPSVPAGRADLPWDTKPNYMDAWQALAESDLVRPRQWNAPKEILFSAPGQALITVKLNWAKYPSCQSISESFTFFFRKGILQADELVTAVGWLWTLTLLLSKFATRGARQVQGIPPSTADFCSLLAHRKVTVTKHWGVTAFCSCCGPMWVCTQSFGRAWKHSPLLGCS